MSSVLEAQLKAKEAEVSNLNSVLMRQGQELKNASQPAVDDTIKRKEGLVRAHQARIDKLELQLEALRDEAKQEAQRRREAEDKLNAAEKAAAINKALLADLQSQGGGGAGDTKRLAEVQEALASAEKRYSTLNAEMTMVRSQLEAANSRVTELEEAMDAKAGAPASEQAEAPAAAAAQETPSRARQSERLARATRRSNSPSVTEEEMQRSLSSEAYRGMQEQRAMMTATIKELEHKLSVSEAASGSEARQRESAAHKSMSERCAKVAAALRVCETQLSRTSAALNPTKLRLSQAESQLIEVQAGYRQLAEQMRHEVVLRVASGRMAAHAFGAVGEAAAEASSLRALCPPPPTADSHGIVTTTLRRRPTTPGGGTESGGVGGDGARIGSAEASAQGFTQVEASTLRTLHERLVALETMLSSASDAVCAQAPFAPQPRFTPLSVLEQLHILGDLPPPPNATSGKPRFDLPPPQQPVAAQPTAADVDGDAAGSAVVGGGPPTKSFPGPPTKSPGAFPAVSAGGRGRFSSTVLAPVDAAGDRLHGTSQPAPTRSTSERPATPNNGPPFAQAGTLPLAPPGTPNSISHRTATRRARQLPPGAFGSPSGSRAGGASAWGGVEERGEASSPTAEDLAASLNVTSALAPQPSSAVKEAKEVDSSASTRAAALHPGSLSGAAVSPSGRPPNSSSTVFVTRTVRHGCEPAASGLYGGGGGGGGGALRSPLVRPLSKPSPSRPSPSRSSTPPHPHPLTLSPSHHLTISPSHHLT